MQQYKKILGKVMMTAEGIHDSNKGYDPISLITDEETGKSYISRKEVPAGTQINNREYWQPVASSGIIDNGVIILNRKNSDGQVPIYDLKSAAEAVAVGDRKGGVILGFLGFNPETDTVPTWKLYQYNDVSPSNWTNIDYWLPMDYTNKYAGWFDNEEALYNSVPFPKVGMYAYVGNSVSNAVVYRCYNDRVWQPTEDKAFTGVVNLADEEDITSKQNKLKFKDKEYNPAQFSGLGRTYLRKNMIDGKNILVRDMINATNTIYIIQYDYDLQEQTITIPEGCILDFQGGSFSNGTIIFSNTIIKSFNSGVLNVRIAGFIKNEVIYADWFGVQEDDLHFDNAEILASLLSSIKDGTTIDFRNKIYYIHNNVEGYNEDSFDINRVLRLYKQTNITLKNGSLLVEPGISSSKCYFPSTLVVDECSNIKIENLTLYSKGENYGDTDASVDLNRDERKLFAAKNGGHALLITRSNNITVNNSKIEFCGSVGSLYIMSSDNVNVNNTYSSPHSLGYAAFAIDSWAGGASISGFSKHRTVLNNCRTNKGTSTYGSKGGVVTEDADVEVIINGGIYEDSYANGSAKFIGSAFIACDSKIIANNCIVNNCAAISSGFHSVDGQTIIEVYNVSANNLRTSAHIEGSTSFGHTKVYFNNCNITVSGTQLWSDVKELSIPTIIANMKTASNIDVYINNCISNGANIFATNSKACYGRLFVNGGTHTLNSAIIDSLGWGSSIESTLFSGFIIKGTLFKILNSGYSSLYGLGEGVIVLKNLDTNNVYTRLHIHFDNDSIIELAGSTLKRLDNITVSGTGLNDGIVINSVLKNLALFNYNRTDEIRKCKYLLRTAIAGSNWRIIISPLDNRYINTDRKLVVGNEYITIISIVNAYIEDDVLKEEVYISSTDGAKLAQDTIYKLF